MKAIKLYGSSSYIIPQLGVSIKYIEIEDKNEHSHYIFMSTQRTEESFYFTTKKGSDLFVKDILDNFEINEIIDSQDKKYQIEELK